MSQKRKVSIAYEDAVADILAFVDEGDEHEDDVEELYGPDNHFQVVPGNCCFVYEFIINF